MKTIYKYKVPITGQFELELPDKAKILTVQMQNDEPFIWALLADENKKVKRTFFIFGTGHGIDPAFNLQYIGTFQQGVYVWHLFEVVKIFIG